MKVVFMGTPGFAMPALQSIYASSHEVIQVYTKPPAKSGRGHKINISPVHELAHKLNIPISYPSTLKDQKIIEELAGLQADIIVVAAYGHILPRAVLEVCPLGCINIHPSLLPRWRGAAPIERTVQAGDLETGVCTMQMDEGLDTGDILLTEKIAIDDKVTTLILYEKLAKIGAELVVKTLNNYSNIIPAMQLESGITYAKKLTKGEAIIDWNQDVRQIDQMIRAFNPWPGSFFQYNGELIKILEASVSCGEGFDDISPGIVIDEQFRIKCGHGVLQPSKLQRPGRNILSLSEFLLGNKISAGTILGSNATL